MRKLAIVAAALLAPAGAATGSDWVASGVSAPALRVDAHGLAEVSWTQGGRRQTLFVPPRGQVFHGGALSGHDVSRPVRIPGLPLTKVTRRTPDGTLFALQEWQVEPGQPPELHLARWRGQPTQLTLTVSGDTLAGGALFQGRPVAGFTTTPAGKRPRIRVYIDCFGCPAGPGWTRIAPLAPKADGSFMLLLRPSRQGSRYRATVAGPNFGLTRAPDAQTVIPAG